MNAPAKLNEVMPQTVEFTLDGKKAQAYAGETILTVAKRLGMEIPHLCYKEGYRPDGNCRACVVEVGGERTLARFLEIHLDAAMPAWRRHLHANPEPSLHEKETAAFVAARLDADGRYELAPAPPAFPGAPTDGTQLFATRTSDNPNRLVERTEARFGTPAIATSIGMVT